MFISDTALELLIAGQWFRPTCSQCPHEDGYDCVPGVFAELGRSTRLLAPLTSGLDVMLMHSSRPRETNAAIIEQLGIGCLALMLEDDADYAIDNFPVELLHYGGEVANWTRDIFHLAHLIEKYAPHSSNIVIEMAAGRTADTPEEMWQAFVEVTGLTLEPGNWDGVDCWAVVEPFSW